MSIIPYTFFKKTDTGYELSFGYKGSFYSQYYLDVNNSDYVKELIDTWCAELDDIRTNKVGRVDFYNDGTDQYIMRPCLVIRVYNDRLQIYPHGTNNAYAMFTDIEFIPDIIKMLQSFKKEL